MSVIRIEVNMLFIMEADFFINQERDRNNFPKVYLKSFQFLDISV